METSKRTWSLPLPVQPCAIVSAPNWCAARTRCLVISGREIAETSGYTPSYMAFALRACMQYSFANSSRASTMYASTACVSVSMPVVEVMPFGKPTVRR